MLGLGVSLLDNLLGRYRPFLLHRTGKVGIQKRDETKDRKYRSDLQAAHPLVQFGERKSASWVLTTVEILTQTCDASTWAPWTVR